MICGESENHTIASVAGPLPIFCHSLSSSCLLTDIDVHASTTAKFGASALCQVSFKHMELHFNS